MEGMAPTSKRIMKSFFFQMELKNCKIVCGCLLICMNLCLSAIAELISDESRSKHGQIASYESMVGRNAGGLDSSTWENVCNVFFRDQWLWLLFVLQWKTPAIPWRIRRASPAATRPLALTSRIRRASCNWYIDDHSFWNKATYKRKR